MRPILKGLAVSPGVASGRPRIVDTDTDSGTIEPVDILVAERSHPALAVHLFRAGGLVCEVGGRLSHLCIVALEMGIPCITQASGALELLRGHAAVLLDANEGVIYALED